ncbi:DUF4032 domain-containing protein, partial [Bacillus sp. S34]|nr:DUF4032 domain-containing protein [Bacillus sp. S34]
MPNHFTVRIQPKVVDAGHHQRRLLRLTGLDAGFLVRRFPGLTRATRAAGFDWTREGVPVSPAAHYSMGGIATDADADGTRRDRERARALLEAGGGEG